MWQAGLERCVQHFMILNCFVPNPPDELKTCQSLIAQQKALISLIEANFTQTVHYMSQERDNALKDRDVQHQEAITLRRENIMVKEQLSTYTRYGSMYVCPVGPHGSVNIEY